MITVDLVITYYLQWGSSENKSKEKKQATKVLLENSKVLVNVVLKRQIIFSTESSHVCVFAAELNGKHSSHSQYRMPYWKEELSQSPSQEKWLWEASVVNRWRVGGGFIYRGPLLAFNNLARRIEKWDTSVCCSDTEHIILFLLNLFLKDELWFCQIHQIKLAF